MTDKRKALEHLKLLIGDKYWFNRDEGLDFLKLHHETIIRALKIADRLNSEPDMNMAGAAMKAWDVQMKDKESRSWTVMMCAVYKAMRDQLLKEVDG